jgi:hypothetical protein
MGTTYSLEQNSITNDFTPKQYDDITLYNEPDKKMRYTLAKNRDGTIIESAGLTLLMRLIINVHRYPNYNADIDTLIHTYPDELHKTNVMGYTPLMIAILNPNIDTIRLLLKLGASCNQTIRSSIFSINENRGLNSLELAIKYYDNNAETMEKVLEMMLNRRACIKTKFDDLITMILKSDNICKIIEILLSCDTSFSYPLSENQIIQLVELYELYNEKEWEKI